MVMWLQYTIVAVIIAVCIYGVVRMLMRYRHAEHNDQCSGCEAVDCALKNANAKGCPPVYNEKSCEKKHQSFAQFKRKP